MKTKHFISLLKLLTLAAITIVAPYYGLFVIASSFAIGAVGKSGLLATFDPAGLTYTADEVRELGKMVLEKFYKKPAISDIFNVVTGIKAKSKIGYLGNLGLVGRTGDATNCVPETSTEKITASEKEWDPTMIEDRFVDCWKDYKDSFWIWGFKNGIDKGDLIGTDYYNFFSERLADAAYEAFLRHAFFGDKTMDNVAGGGYLVDGINPDFFNSINGIWVQAIDIAVANPEQNIVIARNDENTYADQKFTATDVTNKVIHSTFSAMIEGADERLTDDEGAEFLVTKSVAQQYKKELLTYTQIPAVYEELQNGKKVLSYDGIPIRVISQWDRVIKAYLKDGTRYHIPHRAILTVPKEQLALGVEGENDWANFRQWFEKKDNSTYTDIGWMEDAKIREDHMTMFALGSEDLSFS